MSSLPVDPTKIVANLIEPKANATADLVDDLSFQHALEIAPVATPPQSDARDTVAPRDLEVANSPPESPAGHENNESPTAAVDESPSTDGSETDTGNDGHGNEAEDDTTPATETTQDESADESSGDDESAPEIVAPQVELLNDEQHREQPPESTPGIAQPVEQASDNNDPEQESPLIESPEPTEEESDDAPQRRAAGNQPLPANDNLSDASQNAPDDATANAVTNPLVAAAAADEQQASGADDYRADRSPEQNTPKERTVDAVANSEPRSAGRPQPVSPSDTAAGNAAFPLDSPSDDARQVSELRTVSHEAARPTEANNSVSTAQTSPENAPAEASGHPLGRQLAGASKTENSSPGSLTNVQRSRFVQRVARAFQTAKAGEGEIRLRLHPPELGSLRLEVKLQNGALTAHLETESSSARQVLLENLPMLRERLAEQGVRIENFDVGLMDRHRDDTQTPDDQTADQQPRNGQSSSESTSAPTESNDEDHDDSLNVVV